MLTLKASEVRKNWSSTIDTVVREKPIVVNRTRDYFMMMNSNTVLDLLDAVKFNAFIIEEDDGSFTSGIDELAVYENGSTIEESKENLVNELIEYSNQYFNEFEIYSNAPNRKSHLPYVTKIICTKDKNQLMEEISWQHGKN